MKKAIFSVIISIVLIMISGCTTDNAPIIHKVSEKPIDIIDTNNVSTSPETSKEPIDITDTNNVSTAPETSKEPIDIIDTNNVSTAPETSKESMNVIDTTFPSHPESAESTKDNMMDINCKLIVNGKDITSGNHVKLIEETIDAELPLITIMRELGAKVTWKDDTTVTFTHGDDVYEMDISKPDFGLPRPPGSTYYYRAVVDGEVIIDNTSARGLIAWMGAQIRIDVDEMVIEIA